MRRFVVGLAMGIATFAPSWAFADDEQIAKTIVEKLEARKKEGQLKGFNIDLKVDKGQVWLSGHVASAEQQQMALDIAQRADGVEAVVNDLKVKRNASTAKTAETKKVATSEPTERPSLLGRWFGSAQDANAKPTNVAKANKVDANVKPASHEKAAKEKAAKEKAAQEKAVQEKAVQEKAAVPTAPSNEALIEVLAGRLNRHKDDGSLKDFDINLSADQGKVTASGDVSSAEQRVLILRTIQRTPGVTQVVNMLKVPSQQVAEEPTPARAPQVIEAAAPAVAEETPAPPPRAIGRLIPQRKVESQVVPAMENRDAAATGTGVIPAAAPHAAPAPVPTPMPAAPTPAPPVARQASLNVGGYTAIPVQMVPAPFSPGQVSPLQPNAPHMAQRPLAFAPAGGAAMASGLQPVASMPAHLPGPGIGIAPARFDHPNMPGYAWPSYAAHPNYAAVTYPKQYSPSAWPYIGPFYPYPQVPLGWRKVTMQWDDGWWYLDFKDK